jgi:hypothetical protein
MSIRQNKCLMANQFQCPALQLSAHRTFALHLGLLWMVAAGSII